ncbi:hypothetical protein [Micrococcus sp.]|uniref:hypothetical protein n=1 Tax=Micrococcus sp. TaxID=1271 RepID=UPI002A919785|nr:hypothetical protein [Micrococcus sp.]MDY6055803.1 hypothetical protein [Micrococcus sp.]
MLRTVLALLAALLAGLAAVLAGTGALVEEAARRPEMIRGIAETVAEDPDVRAAIPGAVTGVLEDAVPDQIPDQLTQVAEDIVRPIAQRVAEDPDVARSWGETADQARRAWLLDLAEARRTPEPVPGGDFTIPFGPVAQTGVAAALGDVETDLRENRYNLPGQGLLERIVGMDVGDWAADTIVAPMYDRAAALRDATDLRMTVQVDALREIDRTQVARGVAASVHWRWALALAAVLLVAAALTAPMRWRGPALALAGVVTLAGGLLLRSMLGPEDLALTAPEGSPHGVVTLVRQVEQALRPAVADAVRPYPDALVAGAAVALAGGLVLFALELLAGRGRSTRPAR